MGLFRGRVPGSLVLTTRRKAARSAHPRGKKRDPDPAGPQPEAAAPRRAGGPSLSGQVPEVLEVLRPAARRLDLLQVLELRKPDRLASEEHLVPRGPALLEIHSRDRGQDPDPERRKPHPDHLVRLHQKLHRERGHVEAEAPDGRDDLLGVPWATPHPNIDVRRRPRIAVETDRIPSNEEELSPVRAERPQKLGEVGR